MSSSLRAKFHAGTKVQNRNFWILAKISFSAQTTNKIRLKNARETIYLWFSFMLYAGSDPYDLWIWDQSRQIQASLILNKRTFLR